MYTGMGFVVQASPSPSPLRPANATGDAEQRETVDDVAEVDDSHAFAVEIVVRQ